MTSCKHLPYPERLCKLGLPTLDYRRERADMIQTYKILHNIGILDKDKLFTTAQYQATRCHPYKLFKRRLRLNLWANTFSNRVINTWNDLSANVVNTPSVNAFKNRLNKHWHGHPSKFETTCYQTSQPTRGNRQRYQQASSQV